MIEQQKDDNDAMVTFLPSLPALHSFLPFFRWNSRGRGRGEWKGNGSDLYY